MHSPLDHQRLSREHGLTLVELLVAMAIGLVLVVAASSALVVARRGFTTVDAASQLRDNARFATDIIQRLAVQAGYLDLLNGDVASSAAASGSRRKEVGVSTNQADIEPNVSGFNNRKRTQTQAASESTAWATGNLGSSSDILVLRAQAAQSFPGATTTDRSMIDCRGTAVTAIPTNRDDRIVSILHVGTSNDGEPALMCSPTTTGTAPTLTQPLISGVETFQVLYGVDTACSGNAGAATLPGGGAIGSVEAVNPTAYWRADQFTVSSNVAATNAKWRCVRSLRIGMVLRGPVGSAQESSTQTMFPFGAAKASASGTTGSAFASTDDANSSYDAPADGRLRLPVTFTVHLRNYQAL